jgi:hypothetical protein
MKRYLILAVLLPYQISIANSYDYSRAKNPPPKTAVPNVDSLTQSVSNQQTSNTNHADLAGGVQKKSGLTKVIGYGAAAALTISMVKNAGKCKSTNPRACARMVSAGLGAAWSLKQTRNVQISEASACVSGAAVSTVGGDCGSFAVTSTSTPEDIELAVDEAHDNNPTTRDVKQKLKDVAEKAGFKVDPKTGNMTLPNGKSLNMKTASPAEMQAAGLDMGEVKAMINDAYNEAAEKVAMDGIDGTEGLLSEATGGGMPGSLGSDLEYIDDPIAGGALATEGMTPRGPAAVAAGKTKIVRGELIGAQGDDLFLMITRRYAHLNKHQGHTFIQDKP